MKIDHALRVLSALAVSALMAGCASQTPSGPRPEPTGSDDARPPQVRNTTPFPIIGLTATEKDRAYVSLGIKLSYRIDARHQLHLLTDDLEPMLNERHDVADDFRCMAYGGGYNQRTTWYPDTGLFVAGAQLTGVRAAGGQARPLVRLSDGGDGSMAASGRGAREREYAYVPCVGSQRVAAGVRTDGYLQPGDQLTLRPAGKGARAVSVSLPMHTRPFVKLDFQDGGQAAVVPAHPVLMSIDWPRRRAVVQYQVTAALLPQIDKATWMTTLPQPLDTLDPIVIAGNAELERYLASCPSPRQVMDPCADPNRPLPVLLRPPPQR